MHPMHPVTVDVPAARTARARLLSPSVPIIASLTPSIPSVRRSSEGNPARDPVETAMDSQPGAHSYKSSLGRPPPHADRPRPNVTDARLPRRNRRGAVTVTAQGFAPSQPGPGAPSPSSSPLDPWPLLQAMPSDADRRQEGRT
ncbi:hypothetical protein DCS_06739 [Drechmeria coniospora]|uniref:Uncharacterized protein n=1 Tax=Drechmeria coniospora TaxID=98403 RepID=A0A151GCE5_DRECN|nr:hypothetical protein DCS_06739 [Drechmeria coniospora]KYK54779.1 hypothetical protein DCS_06739 [Drechmeria coniospora]